MNRTKLYNTYWLLSRLAIKIGTWGLLAVGLMLVSLLLYISKMTKLEQDILSVQDALNKAQRSAAVVTSAPVVAAQLTMRDVSAYYQQLPKGSALPSYLNTINQAAMQQHLILNRGDYKLTQLKKAEFSRYQIVFPVVGKYTQIRQFIAIVLEKLPALGLSDVQITRENSLSPTVEARLEFVLYLQSGAW
jgi:Tfp pilus assembly protein PilO